MESVMPNPNMPTVNQMLDQVMESLRVIASRAAIIQGESDVSENRLELYKKGLNEIEDLSIELNNYEKTNQFLHKKISKMNAALMESRTLLIKAGHSPEVEKDLRVRLKNQSGSIKTYQEEIKTLKQKAATKDRELEYYKDRAESMQMKFAKIQKAVDGAI